jgi:hypothetical protein
LAWDVARFLPAPGPEIGIGDRQFKAFARLLHEPP